MQGKEYNLTTFYFPIRLDSIFACIYKSKSAISIQLMNKCHESLCLRSRSCHQLQYYDCYAIFIYKHAFGQGHLLSFNNTHLLFFSYQMKMVLQITINEFMFCKRNTLLWRNQIKIKWELTRWFWLFAIYKQI